MNTDTNKIKVWTQQPSLRGENGLLTNEKYVFTESGSVDWRATLKTKPEFLYFNVGNRTDSGYADKVSKLEKKYGKKFADLKVEDADDRDLCVLLGGIRHLAYLRGVMHDERTVNHVTYDPHYQVVAACTVTCKLTWIPNFENNYITTSTDIAGASLGSCYSFTQKHVETIASNRAYIRAVRVGLSLNIVGKDECSPDGDLKLIQPEESHIPSGNQPEDILEQFVKNAWPGTGFEQFKKAVLIKLNDPAKNPEYTKLEKSPEEWAGYNTIPRNDIFHLLGVLKKAQEKKK